MSERAIWWSGCGGRSVRRVRSRLVAIYAVLVVLRYVIPAIPGNLDYPRGTAGLIVAGLVDVLLIVLIARGSRAAAAVSLVMNVGLLLSATVVASGDELVRADTLAYVVVVLAQCAVLIVLLFSRGTESAALRA